MFSAPFDPLDQNASQLDESVYEESAIFCEPQIGMFSECNKQADKWFICECGRKYRYKRGLIAHKKFECGKPPQFQCPECLRKFSRSTTVTHHIQTVHGLKKIYF